MSRAKGSAEAGDEEFMTRALNLAARGYGGTSPNPMVGTVLVKNGGVIGEGWHRRAGEAHAEVNAIRAAARRGISTQGAALFVTLEPCLSHGRTPPCTQAILRAGIREVVVGAVDPNPKHRGAGLRQLRAAGVAVRTGVLAKQCERLNEAFNHWIVNGTPWVTLKCAMTLDGKIATRAGESKWITSEKARTAGMRLRLGADAILAGINTVLADDPALTLRLKNAPAWKSLRRIILDPEGRLPLEARVASDDLRHLTTVVVSPRAPRERMRALEARVRVWKAPGRGRSIDVEWLLRELGREQVTSLLIEGGGETSAVFLNHNQIHRACFFYAPRIFGGRDARKAIGGKGIADAGCASWLEEIEWKRIGPDLMLTGRVKRAEPVPQTRGES